MTSEAAKAYIAELEAEVEKLRAALDSVADIGQSMRHDQNPEELGRVVFGVMSWGIRASVFLNAQRARVGDE